MNKRYTNIIKFIIYLLLFVLILYMEKSMIDMQPGSSIDDKDRSGGIGFMAILGFTCVTPFYILYDICVRKQLYRLLALLLQAGFCLWSLFWFRSLEAIRYNMQYENMPTSDGLMLAERTSMIVGLSVAGRYCRFLTKVCHAGL